MSTSHKGVNAAGGVEINKPPCGGLFTNSNTVKEL